MSSASATSCVYGEFWINDFARLQTSDDSTSSTSSKEFQEFQDFWLDCAKRQMSLRPTSPSHEELMERKQERYRKTLVIALNTYAKRNNMQITDFELVEEKERNLVSGMLGGYVHSNFVVKGVDGRLTLFFAEMEHDCFQEEQVVLCTPLEDKDSGCCFGCNKRAKKLRHPTCGGYLGGLMCCFLMWRRIVMMSALLIESIYVSNKTKLQTRSILYPECVRRRSALVTAGCDK